jgi:hypothetical protein
MTGCMIWCLPPPTGVMIPTRTKPIGCGRSSSKAWDGAGRSRRERTQALCVSSCGEMCSPRNDIEARSFGCQRCVSPLCDDFSEFRRKLVAVTSQPLIKRALRPAGCLLSRFLVARGFALVLLEFCLKITQHGATPRETTRARMVADHPTETMTDLRQFCSRHAARFGRLRRG